MTFNFYVQHRALYMVPTWGIIRPSPEVLHFDSPKVTGNCSHQSILHHLFQVLFAKSNFSFHLVATCLALAKSTNKALVVLPVCLYNKRYSRVKAGGIRVDTFVITIITTSATQGYKQVNNKRLFLFIHANIGVASHAIVAN